VKKPPELTVFILLAVTTAGGAFARDVRLWGGAFSREPAPVAGAFPKETALIGKAKPEAVGKTPFLLFSEGLTCSWLTRITKQSGRSNFVDEDFLPGLYYRMDLVDPHWDDIFRPMIRIAALYPLISTFNKVPQLPKTPLHFGADINLGVVFNILEFAYFRLNAGPALHLFFLNSDRWNYFNMGGAAMIGMELPLAPRWTLIGGGIASLDSGNLGDNRYMEPYDIVFQYHVELGIRYSKRLINSKALFKGKR